MADDNSVRRGQLLWAYVPFISWLPYDLRPEERSSDREHDRVFFRLGQRRLSQRLAEIPQLPIAALPQNPGEDYSVYRTKFRPVLVLGAGGAGIDPKLTQRSARWQLVRTYLVAPFFGADQTEQRGGWNPELVRRIRHCEYPQYFWDQLPMGSSSILRFDQLQPIGQNHEAFKYTPHRLSQDAMDIVDQWLVWYLFDRPPDPESFLHMAREGLPDFVSG